MQVPADLDRQKARWALLGIGSIATLRPSVPGAKLVAMAGGIRAASRLSGLSLDAISSSRKGGGSLRSYTKLAEAMGLQIAVERGKSDRWKALHSTQHHAWETPPELWRSVLEKLDIEQFDLDPCSPKDDGPIPARRRFTELDNGLAQPWHGIVWVNPPYGSVTIWIDKMVGEATHGAMIVALVPARTGARWWHRAIESGAKPQFLQGRIRFWRDGKPGDAAPFDSALLWWNWPQQHRPQESLP